MRRIFITKEEQVRFLNALEDYLTVKLKGKKSR